MSLICGTDFSEASRAAVTAAAAIAGRCGEELWLVHVVDPEQSDLGPEGSEKLAQGAHQRLEAESERVASLCRQRQVLVLTGNAPTSLKRLAEERRASLLVVAPDGHSRRVLLTRRGTSERTASGAPVPVLVVRDAAPFEAWAAERRPLRVVLGADDGAATEAAVRWVGSLRGGGPVDLVVSRVYYADEGHSRYGLPHVLNPTDPNPELEALIERDLKRRFPPAPGEGETFYRAGLGVGRLADHLIELGVAEKADVLVVGTNLHRGLGRLGSVSSGTLHHAKVTVALIPGDGLALAAAGPPPRVRRVLVATDFSPIGNAAVPWAFTLAPDGAEVVLTHVTQTVGLAGELLELYLSGTTVSDQPPARVVEEVTRRLGDLVATGLGTRELKVRTTVSRGPFVARALCETAAREGADLLVLGSHGRAGVKRAVVGSVAEAVLRHSPCPVFIVPMRSQA